MSRWIALLALLIALGGLNAAPTRAQSSFDCAYDLVLAIDTSASMTPENFELLRAFAGSLATSFPLGEARAALISFSTDATVLSGFTSDAGALIGAVNAAGLQGDASDFTTALSAAQNLIAGGARPYVPRGVILLTDGLSRIDTTDLASRVRAQGTILATVGVGRGISRRELFRIVSRNSLAFFSDTFQGLAGSIPNIVGTMCNNAPSIGGQVQTRIRNERGNFISLPAQGVTVALHDGSTGERIRAVVTDERGRYRFAVAPGRYEVRVELPEGASFVPPYDGIIPNAGLSSDGRFLGTQRLFTLIRTPAFDRDGG